VQGEQDFAAYVAARGAAVVRCLSLLGLAPATAERVAAETFAAIRSDWGELAQYADPDVALYSAMVATLSAHGRRHHVAPRPPERVAAVLRYAGGLDEVRVCEVLNIPVPVLRTLLADPGLEDDMAGESDELSAGYVSYGQVRAVAARDRRRRWTWTVATAVGLAALVAVAVQVTSPEPPLRPGDALPAVRVVDEQRMADVAWWADGWLHLQHAALDVGAVQRLVAVGTGAAYVDDDGRLVHVDERGRRTLLGHPDPRTAVVSSPRLGLVAWVDVASPDRRRMVVWDVTEGHQVAAVVTSPRSRTISFDGGWLTFGQGLTDWAWDPAGGPARETGNGFAEQAADRTALVDVVAGTRLEQFGSFLRVVRAGARDEELIPGFGGTLSADGRLVLTGPDPGREPQLYDARTGARVDSWFPPEWHILAATFASADRVAWLVDRGAGDLTLITCGRTDAAAPCSDGVDLGSPSTALLAGDSTR
jgi:hypothetical protein